VIGNNEVSCHNAYEIGAVTLGNIVGLQFEQLKKKDIVAPLASVCNSSVSKLTKRQFDPLNLLHRLCLLQLDKDEMRIYFKCELSLYPLSLFDDEGMYKTAKAALYSIFKTTNCTSISSDCHYVIDGGFLLHRVIWPSKQNFKSICL